MDKVEVFLFATALLLLLCVLLSKGSSKLGFPTLLIFLFVGMLAGSEGVGGIYFDNANAAKALGVVALAFILFSGGLGTKISSIKPVFKSGISLASVGVIITMLSMGFFAHYFLDFTLVEGLLFGAIISSTDAGAVYTVLRTRHIRLKKSLGPLLELESGANDPMAVFLVISILSFMTIENFSLISMIPKLIQQILIGAGVGYSGGKLMAWGFNKLKLEIEGLYTVLSLAMVLLIYTTSQGLNGNGYLSVYLAGVILGNESFIFKKTLVLLHDGVSWLMQSSMFLTLGLLIFPSRLVQVTGSGVLVAAFMILVARPLSVFISMAFSGYEVKEKILISWVGLRGAVPIIMGTYPLVAGISKADYIFNLVFFASIISLLVQGTTISIIAKYLGLLEDQVQDKELSEYTSSATFSKNTSYLTVPVHSELADKNIVELKLPPGLLIVLIERNSEVIIPRGSTEIKAFDKLMVISRPDSLSHFKDQLLKMPKESIE